MDIGIGQLLMGAALGAGKSKIRSGEMVPIGNGYTAFQKTPAMSNLASVLMGASQGAAESGLRQTMDNDKRAKDEASTEKLMRLRSALGLDEAAINRDATHANAIDLMNLRSQLGLDETAQNRDADFEKQIQLLNLRSQLGLDEQAVNREAEYTNKIDLMNLHDQQSRGMAMQNYDIWRAMNGQVELNPDGSVVRPPTPEELVMDGGGKDALLDQAAKNLGGLPGADQILPEKELTPEEHLQKEMREYEQRLQQSPYFKTKSWWNGLGTRQVEPGMRGLRAAGIF